MKTRRANNDKSYNINKPSIDKLKDITNSSQKDGPCKMLTMDCSYLYK